MCLYDTYGCDKLEYEEQCISSILDTEGGPTRARYRPGDVNETLIKFTTNITDQVTEPAFSHDKLSNWS